jgi:serine/threonine protein kinase
LRFGSLDSLLRTEGRLPTQEALDVACQVLDAVAHLQALTPPVIHRDLIPNNVLLVSRTPLAVKIGDFSLAQPVPAAIGLTYLGESVIDFLPPESAHGYYPAGGDLYAVGVMLYAMLTGMLPYPPAGSGSHERLRDLLGARRTPPLPPSTHQPCIDPGLDGLVMRALAPNPRDRFPNAVAFSAATKAVRAWIQ